MQKIRKMQILVVFLMLSITGTLVTIPFSNAQTAASPIPTHAYLTVSPNPVGVGQHVTIQMWLVEFDPRANTYLGKTFENFTVLITKPDGTTQTLGPFTAFDNSFANTIYAPDKVGNYTAKFTFPGNHVIGTTSTGAPVDSYYGASSYRQRLRCRMNQYRLLLKFRFQPTTGNTR
jgi:hypothetical protein